ncbi:aconitase family protein [Pseudomonas sp. CCI3.2]|uniref:cis-3-hydroxy-L-proline dehydratase n=3 Tax=Pseudomonas TaxID=286 RepID=UPI002AC8AEB1|nr:MULTISPECIES: aconitase family protein [unclassified Pseudomonas]MEB0076616.1 aconitase family protein [Pseudomonas sp. MH10out]MEB0100704.1 aconitase family protein [Pseudomonas sp. CCI3.2]MEB0130319.1 aconitase family protein [Pseudomonas sp. CCI2.4]MEB0158847.1 aconitase family protein [Pseudomonas sp. AH2 (2023)]WPX27430.1 aconitase family protein [Pseudomonas sp. AH2]
MPDISLSGRSLVAGSAQGELLYSDVGLSFWGGVDPFSGEIIDRHHPLWGEVLAHRVLAIPSGRGSCTGSSVLLELILNGHAPAALVFEHVDDILTLGVLIAEQMFHRSIPVMCVGREGFAALRDVRYVQIEAGLLSGFSQPQLMPEVPAVAVYTPVLPSTITLNCRDRELLEGGHGKAAQVAMHIILRIAELQGATELLDITQAHIDGCIYTGPASLRFAQQLVAWGANVSVPTTLNSISVDKRRWREQGIDVALGVPASQLGDAYLAMGAKVSFTCAPYLLDSAPKAGEQIVWAESNAVVYANSVLGARTLKYPDYLDICIALTGRAPLTGCHVDQQRHATLRIELPPLAELDDAFYPLLGYHVGLLAGSEIPVICGLETRQPTLDDLKAFGAAFATTSGAPMFHIVGVTPEAATVEHALGNQPAPRTLHITLEDLQGSWKELNSAEEAKVDLVSLGNPHFSLSECATLAALCHGHTKHPDLAMVITCGRAIHAQAIKAGYVTALESFGAQFVTDTCWCMLGEPVVPVQARTLMTNSGKYAHYAPGLVGRLVHFGSLAACVDAACAGETKGRLPRWLDDTVEVPAHV